MPSINIEFLRLLESDYKNYSNFIETGTFLGDTIFNVEKYFSNLYTVEVKEKLYENVKRKYKGDKISFYLGDSSVVLNDILPNIDGHWSVGITGKGKKDVPLYEELNSIMSHHKDEAIIIIDDVNLFGSGPNTTKKKCNWEEINIENVLEIVKDRTTKHYFLPSKLKKDDRLIIHIL